MPIRRLLQRSGHGNFVASGAIVSENLNTSVYSNQSSVVCPLHINLYLFNYLPELDLYVLKILLF